MTLVAVALLSGCLPSPITPEAPGLAAEGQPDTTAYPTSPAGPLPEVAITDLVVLAGADEGEWWVLGLATNVSSSPLEAVRLRIETLDVEGKVTGETTVSLPLSMLQPQASSPFAAQLHPSGAPTSARAMLESFLFSSEEAISLRVGAVYTTKAPDGVFVRGTVKVGGSFRTRGNEVVVAWRDADRSLAGVAVASIPAAPGTGDGSLPWIAFAPGAGSESRFEVFAAAADVSPESESSVAVVDGPAWRVTSQGSGFATGAIRNDGSVPVLPQVAIAAYADDQPISLQILESRIPLQPGETLTFGGDRFPGLEPTLKAEDIDVAEVSLEVYLDARAASPDTGTPVLLTVSIHQFEVIGSRAFLRGAIASPASVSLQSAMVFVSLRSTGGEPLSARWLELSPPPSRSGVDFSVDLPLPSGVDAAMCEYDVRALGLPVSDSSW